MFPVIRTSLLATGFMSLLVPSAIALAAGPTISSEQERAEFLNQRVHLFPATIGTYELYFSGSDKIRLNEDCDSVDSEGKQFGLSGKICGRSLVGEYRATSGNHVVFVHLTQLTEGKEIYRSLLTHTTKEENLEDKTIFRIEGHELAWYPALDFDVVITQEGRWSADSNGNSYSYGEQATGKNPVTLYFLNLLPPKQQGTPLQFIIKAYYEEYEYEICENNPYQNEGFTSKEACQVAIQCLSRTFANLVINADVESLAREMQEHGGESASLTYLREHPEIDSVFQKKRHECIKGRESDAVCGFMPMGRGAQCEDMSASDCAARDGTVYTSLSACWSGGNTDDAATIIEEELIKEFTSEMCDINNSKDFRDRSHCVNTIACMANIVSASIPTPDLSSLAEDMVRNGGEGSIMRYEESHPSASVPFVKALQECSRNRGTRDKEGPESTIPPAGYEEEVLVDFDAYNNPFPDTNLNELSGKSAAELYRRGVIGGFPDGEFKGDRPVNRAENAKFLLLARYGTVAEVSNSGRFPDVLDNQWYTRFVVTAADKGIINGHPNGLFKPGDQVNTAEFLKMLALTFDLPLEGHYTYRDVSQSDWFSQYAGIAKLYDLFPGQYEYLRPDRKLSRYEVAVALYQFLKNRTETIERTSDAPISVNERTDHIKGSASARFSLIEYAGAADPYSRKVHPIITKLLSENNDLNWVYRHFPLDFQPQSKVAAEAMECVAELGGNSAFWSYIENLYAGHEHWDFAEIASSVSLNTAAFQECLEDTRHDDRIQTDLTGAMRTGINGTPTSFLVDNRTQAFVKINGAQPFETFESTLESLRLRN